MTTQEQIQEYKRLFENYRKAKDDLQEFCSVVLSEHKKTAFVKMDDTLYAVENCFKEKLLQEALK